MSSYICAFDNVKQMLNIKGWHDLTRKPDNPYYLEGFMQQFFKSAIRQGLKPLCIVNFSGEKAVGIVPVAISSNVARLKIASFIGSPEFDLDFVVIDEFRESFLHNTVDFLFKTMGCAIIDFSLPHGTKNLQTLKTPTKLLKRPYHLMRPVAGHSVILVNATWAEYEKRRGRNFRKYFHNLENRLTKSGKWQVEYASNKYSEVEIYQQLSKIEKHSWKQDYRQANGMEKDETLLEVLAAAFNSRHEKDFRWEVAFLEFEGEKIAYSFWYEYKQTAFFCKTSFDDRYKKFYPGVYINNVVTRELFNNATVKQIDLMTDLPFHYRWAPQKIPRSRINLFNNIIPMALSMTLDNHYVTNMWKKIR